MHLIEKQEHFLPGVGEDFGELKGRCQYHWVHVHGDDHQIQHALPGEGPDGVILHARTREVYQDIIHAATQFIQFSCQIFYSLRSNVQHFPHRVQRRFVDATVRAFVVQFPHAAVVQVVFRGVGIQHDDCLS